MENDANLMSIDSIKLKEPETTTTTTMMMTTAAELTTTKSNESSLTSLTSTSTSSSSSSSLSSTSTSTSTSSSNSNSTSASSSAPSSPTLLSPNPPQQEEHQQEERDLTLNSTDSTKSQPTNQLFEINPIEDLSNKKDEKHEETKELFDLVDSINSNRFNKLKDEEEVQDEPPKKDKKEDGEGEGQGEGEEELKREEKQQTEMEIEINDKDNNWQQVGASRNSKSSTSSSKSTSFKKSSTTPGLYASQATTSNNAFAASNSFNKKNVDLVRQLVNTNTKCLIILRGCPGSGKSTLANQIKFNGVIVSADNYFINLNGVYVYEPTKIGDAHYYCKTKANEAMKKGSSPIIVDNTNIRISEIKPYVLMATKNNYHVEVIEPETPWRYKASELASKNVHNVTFNKIKKFLTDFEKIDLKSLIEQCKNEVTAQRNGAPPPSSSSSSSLSSTMSKMKPSGFLTNFSEYFTKNDWSLPELETKTSLFDSSSKSSQQDLMTSLFPGLNLKETTPTNSIKESAESRSGKEERSTNKQNPFEFRSKESNQGAKSQINKPKAEQKAVDAKLNDDMTYVEQINADESKNLLKQMFPLIKDEILVDFLAKYHNDIEMVTNILLDSSNLEEFNSSNPTENNKDSLGADGASGFQSTGNSRTNLLNTEGPEEKTSSNENYSLKEEPNLNKPPDKLKDICIKALNNLEILMESHYKTLGSSSQPTTSTTTTTTRCIQIPASVSASVSTSASSPASSYSSHNEPDQFEAKPLVDSIESKSQKVFAINPNTSNINTNKTQKTQSINPNNQKQQPNVIINEIIEQKTKFDPNSFKQKFSKSNNQSNYQSNYQQNHQANYQPNYQQNNQQVNQNHNKGNSFIKNYDLNSFKYGHQADIKFNNKTSNSKHERNNNQKTKTKNSRECFGGGGGAERSNGIEANNQQNESSTKDNSIEKNESENEEEPILNLKLNKENIRCLIQLFGDVSDEVYIEDCTEIQVGFKLAFKLYSNWKKTALYSIANKSNTDTKLDDSAKAQIENDEKLSLFLFDEINMRDPIEKNPVYLSEMGINSAAYSLRQIMAEQTAEQIKMERMERSKRQQFGPLDFNKKHSSSYANGSQQNNAAAAASGGAIGGTNGFIKKSFTNPNIQDYEQQLLQPSPSLIANNGQDMASLVKIQQLYHKYENHVDKKMIDQIFKESNYNFEFTCKRIDDYYELSGTKEPPVIFDIKNESSSFNKSNNGNGNSNGSNGNFKVDYLNCDVSNEEDFNQNSFEYRLLAKKYFNLKQDFFEKASEAYSRGWGAVAQYYADMGHSQNYKIQESNSLASINIFMANNPDIRNSNTLDLHGLQVREAINVLKQVIYEKKRQIFSSSIGKKQKTYLFVVTGYGQHSENGPKLRPNVINYLDQNKVRFSEINPGLLRLDLFNL